MKSKINITIETELLFQVDELAASENRNRSNMIEQIIRKSLEDEMEDNRVKVLYNGKVVGKITTNHSLSIEDAVSLLNIDINEMDGGDPVWDIELFRLEF